MKKVLQIIVLSSLVSWSAFGQNFIRIGRSDAQQQVRLSQDQALEVRLPSTPSTGFGWYPAANTASIMKQVGDWEFISDNPANPVGASGNQVNHYVATAAGTTDLELLYKRPWDDASQATAAYKVTIVSEGAYSGVEVKAYAPVQDPSTLDLVKNDEQTRALPASFSWLDEGKMTVCKNQKSCGSCWAFAACGSFESVIKIWDNVTRDMSEQWLVNCTPGMDCGGGMYPGSMFKSTGCVYEPDQPYMNADGTCKSTYPYHEKPKGYKEIALNPTATQIKQGIYDYGPLWVTVCAGSNFQNYAGGVLKQSDGNQLNHAVVLCGWDDATSSWVLRNSWGTGWGEKQGYMRIQWGVSVIGQHASYFDYMGVIPHVPTGINDINVSAVSVYPNPGSGMFTFSGLTNENTIEVYDYIGNLVYKATSKNSSMAVDLMDQSHGIYMYKVINANGVKTGKLIVN